MDEKTKQEIKNKAKEILDNFSRALEKQKIPEIENNVIREKHSRPEQKQSKNIDNFEFRKIMFENAPQKNKDFIIAEKKHW